jgi:DNA polymerase III delta prime subunit
MLGHVGKPWNFAVFWVGLAAAACTVMQWWWEESSASDAGAGAKSLRTVVYELFAGSIILQSMLGSTMANTVVSAVVGFGKSVLHALGLMIRGALCTSVHVSETQVKVHRAVLRYLESRDVSFTGTAAVQVREDWSMTADQRAALLRRRLVTNGAACALRHVASVLPTGLPVVISTNYGAVLVMLWPLTQGSAMVGSIAFYMLGRNRHREMTELLEAVVTKHTFAADQNPAAIYMPKNKDNVWWWERTQELQSRSRTSVALPEGLMDTLVGDAKTFFASFDEYRARQQPYRRGWLLHGPPGTGKSTTPLVLATELGLPVCVLNLGSSALTDAAVTTLLADALVPSIVLIEDVDAAVGEAVAKRRKDRNQQNPYGIVITGATKTPRLTMATLLNALDGVGAGQGRLTIMTTNDPDMLDEAMVRPGRCDMVVELPAAGTSQIRDLVAMECPTATTRDVDEFLSLMRPGSVTPATIVQVLTCAKGNLRTLLDTVARIRDRNNQPPVKTLVDGYEAAVEVALGKLCQFPPAGLGRRFHGVSSNLYDYLWAYGWETMFAAAVAHGLDESTSATERELFRTACAEAYMDPTKVPLMNCGRYNLDFLTKDATAMYFLRWFPEEWDAAAQFGTTVSQWIAAKGVYVHWWRFERHFKINNDSAVRALEDAPKWLLAHSRTPGDNVYVQPSLERVLYYFGAPDDDRLAVMADGLRAAGCRTADELVAGVITESGADKADSTGGGAGTSTSTSTSATVPGAGTKADAVAALTKDKETTEKSEAAINIVRKKFLQHSMRGSGSPGASPMPRYKIARTFVDAYGVDYCTAMDAARQVTTPDGRSGFSRQNVCALLGAAASLAECVAAMRVVQRRYGFGPADTE